ncbi:hypothetical protein EJB05_08534 [Eragrostis curvula]|uniref:Syntaxin 6 N-terminal domain-containing protein n=1 Tax=Eragrostis curvula TaxID=38414 RepID=A0A5J9W2H4_9POAL|nr:hypothetical protein EJB05_08534 [Eragrostis curvula]
MAAPGGLEQWQKDGLFQAAEEVQESTDFSSLIWTMDCELEQFERAVSSSTDKYSLEDGTVARRQQFVVAIGDQISRVEKALSGSSIDNGRQGLNWVKLDDEERDDLVAFLSAPAQFYSEVMNTDSRIHIPPRQKNAPIGTNDVADVALVIKNIPEVPPREMFSVKSEACGLSEQLHGHRTHLSSGDDHWKIDIGKDEMDDDRKLSINRADTSTQTTTLSGTRKSVESLTRARWFWNSLWKPKSDDLHPSRYDMSSHLNFRGIYLLTQKFNGLTDRSRNYLSSWNDNSRASGRTSGLHIQSQQQNIQFGRSIRITLLLMLSIFLIVIRAYIEVEYRFWSPLPDKAYIVPLVKQPWTIIDHDSDDQRSVRCIAVLCTQTNAANSINDFMRGFMYGT